jgi:hypothetical protein
MVELGQKLAESDVVLNILNVVQNLDDLSLDGENEHVVLVHSVSQQFVALERFFDHLFASVFVLSILNLFLLESVVGIFFFLAGEVVRAVKQLNDWVNNADEFSLVGIETKFYHFFEHVEDLEHQLVKFVCETSLNAALGFEKLNEEVFDFE